jgi:ABC-type antimicrobial peptide transport system permease subunit
VRGAAVLVALGVAAGTLLAIPVARGLSAVFCGGGGAQPATLALTAILLTVVVGLAAILPARRALAIDPMRVLRPIG